MQSTKPALISKYLVALCCLHPLCGCSICASSIELRFLDLFGSLRPWGLYWGLKWIVEQLSRWKATQSASELSTSKHAPRPDPRKAFARAYQSLGHSCTPAQHMSFPKSRIGLEMQRPSFTPFSHSQPNATSRKSLRSATKPTSVLKICLANLDPKLSKLLSNCCVLGIPVVCVWPRGRNHPRTACRHRGIKQLVMAQRIPNRFAQN